MGRQITESQALWAIIAAIIGVDVIWAWSLGIRIVLNPVVVFGFCLVNVIHFVYATVRPDPKIAVFAAAVAQLAAFTAAAGILSYLTVTSKFPLIDRFLASADVAIGFDWLATFNWVQDHPMINILLSASYDSVMLQTGVLLVVLNVIGWLERVREFVWLFTLTLLVIVPLSWIFPAESAWVYFGVTDRTDAYHMADFTALRTGRMPEIFMSRVVGLITFPSFHAALGLILIYATRGIRVLFPLSLGLNVLMIVSTPSMGGHYFIDTLAGLAVVPFAIFILRTWQRQPSERAIVGVDSWSTSRE